MIPAPRRLALIPIALLLALGASSTAEAQELKLDWNGKIQSDLRFRIEEKSVGGYYNRATLPVGVERNQNLFGIKLKATYGSYTGVAALDFVLNGFTGKLQGIEALSEYNKIQPYRFEPQALYIEAKGIGLKDLDVRIGHQIVSWGVGDQFNPTNNLNANDLRDPLLFGRQQANFMVKADYWISEKFSISGVLVPIFKPALLPLSAALGIADAGRLPFSNDFLRHRIESESAFGLNQGLPTVVGNVETVMPDVTPQNMQAAFRLAGQLGEQDLALSYYNGRTDFPQPFLNHVSQVAAPKQCNPFIPTDCVTGSLAQAVSLAYPKVHVYGFNASGEFNPFKWISDKIHGIGYRAEVALVVPSAATLEIQNDLLNIGGLVQPKGEYDYGHDGKAGGVTPRVVEPTPFLKWTLGLDYAFGEHVYTNVQWVHGLADEFGAGDFIHQGWVVRRSGVSSTPDNTLTKCVVPKDGTTCAKEMLRARLGDYLVVGVDLKFASDAGLFRLFTIWDLSGYTEDSWDQPTKQRVRTHYNLFSKEGFSAVIYPELGYNFGNGLELSGGALLELGKTYTKFGDPAAGGSTVFTRGRFSF